MLTLRSRVSKPNSIGELRLARLRQLRDLQLEKQHRDAERARAQFTTPAQLAKKLDPATVSTPALELLDENLIDVADGECERLIWSMPPQEGKALALDTPIATPDGWKTMGDLRIGDQVFDRRGEPCNVTWISPIWRGRPCYVVRTGDGEAITADSEHEWPARLDRRGGERLHTSATLAQIRGKNAQITGTVELNLPDADLPLDPYLLGAWLGDGTSNHAAITCAEPEIVERIRMAGVPCRKLTAPYLWSLTPEQYDRSGRSGSPVRQALEGLGVWGNKHIPDLYMRGSTKQRLALLQGLVDTDGYVSPKGQTEFCSIRRELALGVQQLVFSLGAKATLIESRAVLNGRDCGPRYRVRFYLVDSAQVRYVWAHQTESVPTRCIEVDSPDHTYLAGKTLLPTHNSQRVSRCFALWMLVRNPALRLGIASYELGTARRWGRAIRGDIGTYPDLGLRVRSDTSAAHEWQLEGAAGGVYSVGIGGPLTGRPLDGLVVDDPVKGREEADSETYREAAWEWWTETARPRLAPHAFVVVVATRWHEDDLIGRLITNDHDGQWRVINVPAQCEDPGTDPLGREVDEYLLSARDRTEQQWQQTRRDVGERGWTALYQGRPAPAEGGMLKRGWWRFDDAPVAYPNPDGTMHAHNMDRVIQSWDMAFKDTKTSSFVVGQVWGKRAADAHLLDQVRDRMDFPGTCRALAALSKKWPQASLKLVEDKANGPAVIAQLRQKIGGLVPVTPQGSKEARAAAVSPFVESGNVYIPAKSREPWVDGFVNEAVAFPTGANDDQVDAMSQALSRLLLGGSSTDFLSQLANQQPA